MIIVQFDYIELALLGDQFVDVWREFGICLEDFAADGALCGGFDFGFCAGGQAVEEGCQFSKLAVNCWEWLTLS